MHDDYHCMPMHPFAPSDLSEDEKRDVELVQLLLSKAEKVGYQQHDRARRLLLHCKWISSARCNSVQRVVFHFALALRERIAKESGRSVKTAKGEFKQNDEIDEELDNIKDFPIELLKIMTVGSTRNERIEETGKRLGSVTESMNLPFSFKSIILSDVKDIKEDFFEIEDDEIMIIFASLALRTMISRPSWLENFMRVITNLNPSIMIVFEVEANHNSPSFVNRFIESLFFCCAYFDSLETCMEKHEEERMKMETIMGGHIRNLVAEEGRGRKNRSVTIDVWRAFFARFRMLEIGLSQSSLNQASLVAERFSCRNYCTLDKNGKCLIVGWKGTPLHSLSVWNFMS
ncbi:DELLA protein GAI1-like [Carya illinoinensis]|uniref:DELLA protein GAI1-like n=1 Tax=Carya illinoinensis TaxID=32201 RepID=UPI001C71F508|nr:DELLA protein GAI1-like [Carya illinoinensis]